MPRLLLTLVALTLIALTVIALTVIACGAGSSPSEAASPGGRELYVQNGCAVCHGADGRGDGPVAATLDPPPRDLRDPSTYRVGASLEEVASTIEKGVLVFGGSGMPAYPHIPAEERLELARYIVSLQEERKE